MQVRARTTAAGKACLLAVATFGATALLFGHPLPSLAAGFALGLWLFTPARRATFERLRFPRLPPARLLEDEERLLELEYACTGASAPLAVVVRSSGPAALVETATPALLPTQLGRLPARVRALKRGRHERLVVEVQLRGALGLRVLAAGFEVATDLWVLPRPRQLRERVLEQMLALRPAGSERPHPIGPGDGEFHSLRDWRPGDPERRVSARLSARRRRKVLRIHRGEAPPLVQLVVDVRVARGLRRFGQVDFDEAMRFAAGIVQSLLRREVPLALTLLENGGPRRVVDPSCRDLHVHLGALALARAQPCDEAVHAPELAADPRAGRRVLLHLGLVDETRLAADWLAIRVGSRAYYRLLDLQHGGEEDAALRRAAASAEADLGT